MEQDLGSNLSPNYFENLSMAEKKEIINNDNILDDYDYSGEVSLYDYYFFIKNKRNVVNFLFLEIINIFL